MSRLDTRVLSTATRNEELIPHELELNQHKPEEQSTSLEHICSFMILQASQAIPGKTLKQNKTGRSRFQVGFAVSVLSSRSVPSCSHSPPPSARTDGSANSPQTETQSTFPLFVLQTDGSVTAFQTLLCRGSWGTAGIDTGKCPESFVEDVRNLTGSCLAFSDWVLGRIKAEARRGGGTHAAPSSAVHYRPETSAPPC